MALTKLDNLAFIVLNWNNSEDTIACIESLQLVGCPIHQVIVVDNGSIDNSAERILARFPQVQLLALAENLGYAGGNNVGIRHALELGVDIVFILNNDVVVEPEFLEPLLATLGSAPEVGIATPALVDFANKDRVWAVGARIDWSTANVVRQYAGASIASMQYQAPFDVEVAAGAAMVVKREVFESVGLLDEAFYLYFEEVDWSLKVRQSGFSVTAVPASVVRHRVSAALGASSPVIDYYMLRNHLYLIGRHWSGWRRLYALGRLVLRNLLVVVAYTVKPRGGTRIANRDARIFALRDAMSGRWGKMGSDVEQMCRRAG